MYQVMFLLSYREIQKTPFVTLAAFQRNTPAIVPGTSVVLPWMVLLSLVEAGTSLSSEQLHMTAWPYCQQV